MKYCQQCGQQMQDDAKVCSNCGTAFENPDNNSNEQEKANQNGNKFEDAFAKFNDTKDESGEFDPADISKNKGISVLSYFGILFLVPLLAAKDSKFARFHVNQGIILLIASAIIGVITGILNFTMQLIGLGIVGGIISAVINLAVLVFVIIGIVNAANGKAKELPLIGKFRLIK